MAGGAAAQSVSYQYLTASVESFSTINSVITVDNSGSSTTITGAEYVISGLPASAVNGMVLCVGNGAVLDGHPCGTSGPVFIGGNSFSVPLNTIAAGEIVSFGVVYGHGDPISASYTETHTITGIPPNSQTNTVTLSATPLPIPPVAFYPVPFTSTTTAPDTVSRTLQFSNNSGVPHPGVPAGATYAISGLPASGISAGMCDGSPSSVSCTATLNGSTLEVTLSAIPAGTTASFTVEYHLDATVPVGTAYTETHFVSGSGVGPNIPRHNPMAVLAALPPVLPAITPTTAASVTPPTPVYSTINIDNTAAGAQPIPAGAVYTIDQLLAGASNATCTGAGCGSGAGAASIIASGSGKKLTMTLGAIGAGVNASMTIKYDIDTSVTAPYTEIHAIDASTIAELASVAPQNNTINITAAAVLASVSWSSPYTGTAIVPGTVTHTVTVNNTGGAAIAAGATYTISGLPTSGFSAGNCTLAGCTLTPSSGSTLSGGTLTATLPAINAGASVTFSVSYALDNTVPVGTNYTEQHTLSGTGITTGRLSNPISVMPFASGQGSGATSVPVMGPLGLLLLSLLTAGRAGLAARRRRA